MSDQSSQAGPAWILPDFAWEAAMTAAAAAGDARPTWAYDWPAGRRLAGDLPDLAGKNIIDLGCGRGVLGCTALTHGASRVLFADGSGQVLEWIAALIATNGWQDRASALRHDWGEPLPAGDWDLLLGGDILYRPECFTQLIATVAAACRAGVEAWLADPRLQIETSFLDGLRDAGLTVRNERREAGYTLLVVSSGPPA